MLKQMRTVVIVLGLAITIAYCDRLQKAPTGNDATTSTLRETTRSTEAAEAKNALPDHGGHIAVIDLNKIAADIGQAAKIKEAAAVREHNLQMSIRVIQEKMQKELRGIAKKIGERPRPKGTAPTPDEKKLIEAWESKMQKLERMRLDASNRLRQVTDKQRQANQMAIRTEMNKVRDRIKPLARRIAAKKGLDAVLTTSSVLTHNNAIDITGDVFKEVNELLKAGEFPTVTIPIKIMTPPKPAPQSN